MINSYQISGLLSYPSYTRATKKQQFISVNKQPIRSRISQHSIYEGYHQFLSPGQYPAFFLYLQCPAESIDVNVHPTKREIRFSNEENLHQRLTLVIKEKLLRPKTIPEIRIPVKEKVEIPQKTEESLSAEKMVTSKIVYEILSPIIRNNFLEDLGFEIKEFGGRNFIVHSVPAILASGIDEKVIRDLLDILSEEMGKEKIIRTACRSAVKAKDNLEKEKCIV